MSKPVITMTGVGAVTGVPDELRFEAGVVVQRPSVAEAMSAATEALSRLLQALDGAGVEAADRRTLGMNVEAIVDWSNNTQTITGHSVQHRVEVRVRNLARSGAVLAAVAEAAGDATRISGVHTSVSDTTRLVADARAAAVKDATVKAGQYAAAAGLSLGRVRAMEEVSNGFAPVAREKVMAMAGGAADVPIEAGEQEISAQVSMVWELLEG